MNKPDLTPEQMAQRILELEAQLKQEQMRSAVQETMIDLAESDIKISIRKNMEPNSPSSQGASSTVWTACTLRAVELYPSGILRTIEIQANQGVGVGYHPDAGSCCPRRFSPQGGVDCGSTCVPNSRRWESPSVAMPMPLCWPRTGCWFIGRAASVRPPSRATDSTNTPI